MVFCNVLRRFVVFCCAGIAAFCMPNAEIDPATPLSAFVVPLESLEAVAGDWGVCVSVAGTLEAVAGEGG